MPPSSAPQMQTCDIPGKQRFSFWNDIVFETDEKYKPLKLIGKGAYGVVCSAEDTASHQKVAIKKIENAFSSRIDALRCLREVNLLRHICHADVVRISGIMQPANEEQFRDVYVVYECMDTDLHQIIRSKQPLSDDHHKYIIMQTLRGLMYLHSANIVHRDLKPSNLLLNANCKLKIADFGLARSRDCRDDMTQYVVTRWYRAPEVLLMSPYSKAIDMWSVGCILGELILGAPLFKGNGPIQTLQKIVELLGKPTHEEMRQFRDNQAKDFMQALPPTARSLEQRFSEASPEARDLVSLLLQYDPARRPSAGEALAHPWFDDIRDPSSEIVSDHVFEYQFDEDMLEKDEIFELMKQEIRIWNGMGHVA